MGRGEEAIRPGFFGSPSAARRTAMIVDRVAGPSRLPVTTWWSEAKPTAGCRAMSGPLMAAPAADGRPRAPAQIVNRSSMAGSGSRPSPGPSGIATRPFRGKGMSPKMSASRST